MDRYRLRYTHQYLILRNNSLLGGHLIDEYIEIKICFIFISVFFTQPSSDGIPEIYNIIMIQYKIT